MDRQTPSEGEKKRQYRQRCLSEKGEECDVCGTDEHIVVHHIDGNRQNNDLENLVPLCHGHHKAVHNGRENVPEQYVRALGKEPKSPDEGTGIQVTEKTWVELNRLKRKPGESFDQVVQRLLRSHKEENSQ